MSDRGSPSAGSVQSSAARGGGGGGSFPRYGRGGGSRSMYSFEDQYSDGEEEEDSFTSGLSPRGSAAERRPPLDLKAATKVMRDFGTKYGAAQGLRKVGKSPFSYGIVDDLSSRLAFQQLNTLSGITAKMQQAIDHNKRAFEQRVAETYKLTMRHAFTAWQDARRKTVIKEQKVLQAQARIERSLRRRVLLSWRYVAGLTDPTIKMKNKAAIIFARNLKRRVLLEWYAYVQEESYRDEWKRREAYIKACQHRQRGAHTRMVKAFLHTRLLRIFSAWNRWSHHSFLKRHKRKTADAFYRRMLGFKTLLTFKDYREDKIRLGNLRVKLHTRLNFIFLSHVVAEWAEVARYLTFKRLNERKAQVHHDYEMKRKSIESFAMIVDRSRTRKGIFRKMRQRHLAAVFKAWVGLQSYHAANEILVQRSLAKRRLKLMRESFYSFCDTIIEMKNEREGTSPEALEAKIRELEEKNHKLQLENNRYGKFVDTADLGRGRMKQLSDAVSNLQNEGSELKDLVSLMRTDYENMSVDGGKHGKQRMVTENALQRNKMLVKGGSSFNGLIRALKQDLVDSRKPKRKMGDENLLYEVDRLSLDEVTVLPDGEIKVKAVPPRHEEVVRYKPAIKKEPKVPTYVPTGGRSTKLGSQTLITSALKKLSKDDLGKLEKYLDASTRSSQQREAKASASSDRPSSSRSRSLSSTSGSLR